MVFFLERKGQCDSNLAIYLELGLSLPVLLKIRYGLCSMRYALREGDEVVRGSKSLAFEMTKPGFIFGRWRNGVEGKICRKARP